MEKITREQWEQRVSNAGAGRYKFVRWAVDGDVGALKKCVVRCVKDGHEWSPKISDIVNGGYGCPQCAGVRRWTSEERIEQINKLEHVEFVSWVDGYKNNRSKANVRCKIDNFKWSASVYNFVNHAKGCPKCAKYGYDKSKAGFLYSLRSECGRYVKVGISNNPERRKAELIRSTPFAFSCIEQFSDNGVKIYELEKHFHNKYESAGFSGFDGCTEWLVCSNELLSELRRLSIEHE